MSNLTLSTAHAQVREVLMDAGAETWPDAQIDQGLRLALHEYSRAARDPNARVRPRVKIGAVTPGAGERETSLAALEGLLDVERVWFPYDAAAPDAAPVWVAFELWRDDGAPVLFLPHNPGDGTSAARVWYQLAHTLTGLDGATSSTFDALDDQLLVGGAAGHACLMRSTDLTETAGNMAVSTPNYGALADLFLGEFRAALKPRKRVRVAKLR